MRDHRMKGRAMRLSEYIEEREAVRAVLLTFTGEVLLIRAEG